MRWYREEYLRVIEQRKVVVIELELTVGFQREFAVDALRVWIYFSVPTERNRGEVTSYLI